MEAPTWVVLVGDARERLAELEPESVQTCVTSPPYFGLRDYGTGEWEGGDPACDHLGPPMRTNNRPSDSNATFHGGTSRAFEPWRGGVCGRCGARRVDRQIGLEPTPDEFVAALVDVFREVRRVLRDDGTVWLNLGDSYAAGTGGPRTGAGATAQAGNTLRGVADHGYLRVPGVKPKDLLGIPWMVAFALRADGWYLRSDIVWSKPNPMPESVTDRPTKAHEYVFLLSKGPRYFYDADAIREPNDAPRDVGRLTARERDGAGPDDRRRAFADPAGRNKRSVWTVATQPYAGAHFATFPPKLIEPCILAGAPERACGECGAPWVRVVEKSGGTTGTSWHDHSNDMVDGNSRIDFGSLATAGDEPYQRLTLGFEPSCSHGDGSARGVVLDPFAGAGTTGLVALQHGREFVGIELSPDYAAMARQRIELAVRLGFRAPETGPEVPAEQAALFDV